MGTGPRPLLRGRGRSVTWSARMTPDLADLCRRAVIHRIQREGQLYTSSEWTELVLEEAARRELGEPAPRKRER